MKFLPRTVNIENATENTGVWQYIYNDNIADVLENRIKTGLIYLIHNWEI